MNGTSDFSECHALVKRIFNKDAPCLIEKCSLLAVLFPSFEAFQLPTGFPPASPGSFYGVYQPRVYEVPFLAFVPGTV